MPRKTAVRGICAHCEKNRAIASRGLCRACWDDQSIRAMYCQEALTRGGDNDEVSANMSMEELDALIARQSVNLPPWWEHATRCAREPELYPDE